jgi:hypothetical protein
MSWETVPAPYKRRPKEKASLEAASTKSEGEIRRFLETYKTELCSAKEPHNSRLCSFYHAVDDQRRNPYETYYSPEDEHCVSMTVVERMYHPVVYKTAMCRNVSSCVFGTLCAHAHFEAELRDRTHERSEYENSFSEPRHVSTLSASIQPLLQKKERRNYDLEARESWAQLSIKPSRLFLPLASNVWFVLKKSNHLFGVIQESALEAGLGTVALRSNDATRPSAAAGQNGLLITALDPDDIVARVRSLLEEPSVHFATVTKTYGKRVISILKARADKSVFMEPNLLAEYLNEGKLRMTTVRTDRKSANELLKSAVDTLEFWIRTEKYDDFQECRCCGEERNADQGIACAKGHFYCSLGDGESDQCFAALARSQFIHLHTRQEYCLRCPECEEPYDTKSVASNLPESLFEQFEKAIVDAQVTKQVEQLNEGFNQRLQDKVAEVLSKYGNAKDMLRQEAKQRAKEARDTVLNLKCPHCGVVYDEFEGCMALVCQTCENSFCGYCHQKTATSLGAHEHVQQCLMNETAGAGYFATPEQVRDAQKRYRTREIKRFLQRFKKDLQNEIVIELQRDLADLSIRQEALFELGNLMEAVEE